MNEWKALERNRDVDHRGLVSNSHIRLCFWYGVPCVVGVVRQLRDTYRVTWGWKCLLFEYILSRKTTNLNQMCPDYPCTSIFRTANDIVPLAVEKGLNGRPSAKTRAIALLKMFIQQEVPDPVLVHSFPNSFPPHALTHSLSPSRAAVSKHSSTKSRKQSPPLSKHSLKSSSECITVMS